MVSARVARGRESERLIAADLRKSGCPDAEAVGACLQGRDILNWAGVAVEIKSKRDLRILDALRQTERNADNDIPLLIVRFDGQGEQHLDEWVAMKYWKHEKALLREAGYLA